MWSISAPPSKADRHSVAVVRDGRAINAQFVGRQFKLAGVRCWHHVVSAVTHSEGADATFAKSRVKSKSPRHATITALTNDNLANSSRLSPFQNFEHFSKPAAAVQNVWKACLSSSVLQKVEILFL
jgi:hypothetical protein